MSHNDLSAKSRVFVRHYKQPLDNWFWFWVLERMKVPASSRGLPNLQVLPRYKEDFAVLQCVRRAIREASKKENTNKILIFDSLTQERFLSQEELANLDSTLALWTFSRLEAFLNIYTLEGRLSVSIVPFGELIDELENLIKRFKSGEDNRTLIEPMRFLSRRIGRRWTQAIASGAIGSLALFALTPLVQITALLPNLARLLVATLVGLLIFSSVTTWESFPAILSPTRLDES